MIRRWKVICSYDGTDFDGWQSQPNGNTIQDVIEKRLAVFLKKTIRIQGSGRTDAGVHARGQVFHFDAEWSGDAEAMRKAIKTTLPASILIQKVIAVNSHFHARFSAFGKRYNYRFYLGEAPPHLSRFTSSQYFNDQDLSRMESALQLFEGWHDFESFASNRGIPYDDTVRYISDSQLVQNGKQVTISIEGNGFLYKMVRSMVGAAFQVQRGRLSLASLKDLLDGKLTRSNEIVTAPALGLSLEKVYYRNRNYPPK